MVVLDANVVMMLVHCVVVMFVVILTIAITITTITITTTTDLCRDAYPSTFLLCKQHCLHT
jgi:hypothetical protein